MPKADYGAGASNAISGATVGFGLGGPPGAAVGSVLGFAGGLFGGKKKKKKKKLSRLDANQQQLNDENYQALHGEGPLADLYSYDPEAANDVFEQNTARPAYRDFNENIVPGITGQFRSQGLSNSSYTGNALSKAGRDVQENLDALRAKFLYGEKQDMMNAKRNAVENFQNRTTFDYESPSPESGGFNMDKLLDSVDRSDVEKIVNYFKPKKSAAGV